MRRSASTQARGIKFETFAERRIRGAMIDALRKDAWPRGVRRVRRELEAAREKLRVTLGHEPSLSDLAAEIGADEKRLGKTIVRINTIESTSPLSCGEHVDEAQLPAVLVPAEPERPDNAYERTEVRERVRGAIDSLPVRERRVISLYYYGEVTMKEIGAELGVNESRVSQLHARALRRLREALGADMASTTAAASLRAAILAFEAKPKMAKAHLHQTDTRDRRSRGRTARRGRRLRERFARRAQQVAEPERLGQPETAGFLEESLGVGARHRAGHEDHAPRERRRRRRHGAVELHPIDPGHLQIADDQIEGALGETGQALLAVRRPLHHEPRIAQRFRHRRRQRRLVFDDQHAHALERLQ